MSKSFYVKFSQLAPACEQINDFAYHKYGEPLAPFNAHHNDGASCVEGYSQLDGKKYVIAQAFSVPGIKSEVVADLIVNSINRRKQLEDLISEMLHALELCLESGSLTWEAEQEADKVAMKTRQII